MISSAKIQECYINLYKTLRNYLWEVDTVQDIVNLELDVFKAIPDVNIIYVDLGKLKSDFSYILSKDQDISDAIDAFYNVLGQSDVCCLLDRVQEV